MCTDSVERINSSAIQSGAPLFFWGKLPCRRRTKLHTVIKIQLRALKLQHYHIASCSDSLPQKHVPQYSLKNILVPLIVGKILVDSPHPLPGCTQQLYCAISVLIKIPLPPFLPPPPAMSQRCWRPRSPTAAGPRSGWRCRRVGHAWCSTSGCCWAHSATVALTHTVRDVPALNAAQPTPPVTSVWASDLWPLGQSLASGGGEQDRTASRRSWTVAPAMVPWRWGVVLMMSPCTLNRSPILRSDVSGQRWDVMGQRLTPARRTD